DLPWNRSERSDELNPQIAAWAAERTSAEIVELASLMRIPAIEVGNGATIPRMDHFAEYGFYEVNPAGEFVQPTAPFRFHPPPAGAEEARGAPPSRGPPIASRLRPVARPSVPERASPSLPLEGIRVADFTSFWAGPFLTHTMAMFGADVIH